MNIAFKLMVFSLVFNAAIGIMANVIIDSSSATNALLFSGNGNTGGLSYNNNYTYQVDLMKSNINPDSIIQDSSNNAYQVLNKIGLGFLSRLLTTVDWYLFGFINMMNSALGRWMEPTARAFLFLTLKGILSAVYIIGGMILWTGRNIEDY